MKASMWVKLYVGTMAAAILVGMTIAKHFWSDLDIGVIVASCLTTLTGLGVMHATSSTPAQPQPENTP